MPMNEQPPWGQKKRPTEPEDPLGQLIQKILDLFFSKEQKKPQENEPPKGPINFFQMFGAIISSIAILVIVLGLYSSYYTIKPGEVGVILRFGKVNRTTKAGLHFKIPYLEEVIKVDIETVRKEEFGRKGMPTNLNMSRINSKTKPNIDRNDVSMESLMLTGDKNVIEVAWAVQYTINDPVDYLFQVRDVAKAIRDASETVTRRIVGNMDFDFVLGNREQLATQAKQELQAQVNRMKCGVNITTLQLLDINAPEPVRPAFNEVNMADQDKNRLVNEAEAEYNRVIPKARGSAKQTVEAARGYATERINRARGETTRFLALLKEYEGAESVTRLRMHMEAMQEILPKVEHVYILDKSQQHNILPIFDLSRRADGMATSR